MYVDCEPPVLATLLPWKNPVPTGYEPEAGVLTVTVDVAVSSKGLVLQGN